MSHYEPATNRRTRVLGVTASPVSEVSMVGRALHAHTRTHMRDTRARAHTHAHAHACAHTCFERSLPGAVAGRPMNPAQRQGAERGCGGGLLLY